MKTVKVNTLWQIFGFILLIASLVVLVLLPEIELRYWVAIVVILSVGISMDSVVKAEVYKATHKKEVSE